jgi:hypothetical protein
MRTPIFSSAWCVCVALNLRHACCVRVVVVAAEAEEAVRGCAPPAREHGLVRRRCRLEHLGVNHQLAQLLAPAMRWFNSKWSDLSTNKHARTQASSSISLVPAREKISADRIRNFRDIMFTSWVQNFSSIVRNFHIFKILSSK